MVPNQALLANNGFNLATTTTGGTNVNNTATANGSLGNPSQGTTATAAQALTEQ